MTSAVSYDNTNRVMLTLTVHEQRSKPANKMKLRDLLPLLVVHCRKCQRGGIRSLKY